jgi:ABC-2 type transport system permease protein
VVVPPERLSRSLLRLSWLNPATYAASALRQALIGPVTGRIALDLTALIGATIVVLGIVTRVLDWRQN